LEPKINGAFSKQLLEEIRGEIESRLAVDAGTSETVQEAKAVLQPQGVGE